MKSRRVTKLLACVLATTMCAVPVFASEPNVTADDTTNEIGVSFGKKGVNVRVSVPTTANLQVNPFWVNAPNTVSGSEIASDDLRIINRTWREDETSATGKSGVSVNVTAGATINNKAEGVKIIYQTPAANADTFAANSEEKNVKMELKSGTLDDISGNGTYTGGSSAVVTQLGSRIKFAVDAPTSVSSDDSSTVSDGDAGLGAMAILGNATVNASWVNSDLEVGVVYNIKASNTPDSYPAAAPTFTSGKTTITDAMLNKATIERVCLQDPVGDEYGLFDIDLEAEGTLKAVTTSGGGVELTIPTETQTFLKETATLKGKPQDVLIQLSDGRVLTSTVSFS